MAAQREWFEKDYYKVLGVVPTASDKEITRAYRKLAKEHHPDANPGSEERFKEIQQAYDTLSDEEKRKQYDAGGRFAGRSRAGPPGQRGAALESGGVPSLVRLRSAGSTARRSAVAAGGLAGRTWRRCCPGDIRRPCG